MSERGIEPSVAKRLLTFEVGGALYALPIAGVVEVAEAPPLAGIPTLPPRVGGVMNFHGDALPVIQRSALLDLEEAELPEPGSVVVIADPASNAARLGLPVDRVLGLVDGNPAEARGSDPVAERRPMEGRVGHVLDAQRLVERAREVIERSLTRGE